MKKLAIILAAVTAAFASAQQPLQAQSRAQETSEQVTTVIARQPRGYPMYYEVHDGDTTFFDTIDPIWVFPRGRGFKKSGDWRKEYRLVYNFNKIYPYALVGRKMMAQVDSTIAADATKKSERNQYIKQVEKELLSLFSKDIKNMTTSQGVLLMRLVDRECGMSAFDIIKEYENGFAANFWQVIAKVFSQDLKLRYDPKDRDAKIEELVKVWDSGQWDQFYYSVFWESPKKTVIKTERLQSEVQKESKKGKK
ncbi:MAG: DUF4294 domain-containing protein [Bacteroidales bacterium]|nr:DUF4294 domain-containing protein [Bacteroidales bacterium]